MVTYLELEELKKTWNGEICIFGAGELGKYPAYDLIETFGFRVDFYCDNYMDEGILVRNDIAIRDNQYLYDNKNNILVFLCITIKYQKEVLAQLNEHEIKNIVIMDTVTISNILDSIDKANNSVKIRYRAIYDDIEVLSKMFRRKMKCDLNIKEPKTFNEKLQWLKLYDRKPEYTQMVDKYEAKEFAASKIGREHIITTLGVYNTFDEIEFDKLPQQFVLKCTHDSASVVICKDKDNFNRSKAKDILGDKLKRNYYWTGRDWPYKNIKPRIIAETMMKERSGEGLIDYKFYCFHGEPKFIYISAGLENHATAQISFYNLDLSKADFQRNDFKNFDKIPKIPKHYDEMIKIARIFSKDIPFVRVDLYEINEIVYFSEMTFRPCGGMMPFNLKEYDEMIGQYIDLDRVKCEIKDKI